MSVRRSRRSRRLVTIGAIVALIVADVVLVGALWRTQHSIAPGSEHQLSIPDASEPDRPAPTGSPTGSASASAKAAVYRQQFLAVVDQTRAVRGSSPPTCLAGGSPTLETTADGGTTWGPIALPTDVSLVRVQRLAATSSGLLLLGSDEACQLHLFSGAADGSGWTLRDADLPDAWYITPQGAVNAPGGRITEPCEQPVTLAVRGSSSAAVVCDDDAVYLTTDSGVAWTRQPTKVDQGEGDALALVPDALVVADRDASCPEVRVRAFGENGSAIAEQSCVTGDGSLALAAHGDEVWLNSDSGLQKSGDRGKTW